MDLSEKRFCLFGDGIRDDTDAIQAMLDTGVSCVDLPVPEKCYAISRTLRIHARQTLRLAPTTEIRLLPGSSCIMVKNDPADGHEDIALIGGIWNMNNLAQAPNPIYTRGVDVDWTAGAYADDEYLGVALRFYDVRRLTVSGITIKDPVTFGAQFARLEHFTIENVNFDYNHGNPYAINMDGIHLDGFCRFGKITNLQGTCYDDLLALNADDFLCGPIEDIAVDGLFAKECHSAVRLLSAASDVRRIHITNVFGSFYQYVIGFTRFYETHGPEGRYDQICLSNVYAEKYPRLPFHRKEAQPFEYAPIWIEGKVRVKNLQIRDLHRRESRVPIALVHLEPNAVVDVLSMEHVSQENDTGTPIPILWNEGRIGKLFLRDVQTDEPVLKNDGVILSAPNVPE